MNSWWQSEWTCHIVSKFLSLSFYCNSCVESVFWREWLYESCYFYHFIKKSQSICFSFLIYKVFLDRWMYSISNVGKFQKDWHATVLGSGSVWEWLIFNRIESTRLGYIYFLQVSYSLNETLLSDCDDTWSWI